MRKYEANLNHKDLLEKLDYDPDTGDFFWKTDRYSNKLKGLQAGYLDALGYCRICLNNQNYMAHRLAWFYVYRRWPEEEIDHINSLKYDNRIKNLREATGSQNRFNRSVQKNNKLGIKGVSRHSQMADRYIASIKANKKTIYLGLFTNLEDAIKARAEAQEKYHGQFGRN